MIWITILPKYGIEMCQIMKIGQIVVLCDLSDTRLTVPARKPSPISKEYLILVSVRFNRCGRNHQAYFKVHLGHYVTKQWCTSDWNDLLVTCAQSAPGWTQEGTLAQRAVTPVHPNGCPGNKWDCVWDTKVHFGTIVEGSFLGGGGGGGGDGARWVLQAPSLKGLLYDLVLPHVQ